MQQPDEAGFVKRGLALLGAMTCLGLVVLTIILYRPERTLPQVPAAIAARESEPGWQVRYNAAVTLARRGSDHVPWKLIREMLDEGQQLKNYPVPLADGREVPDEAAARATVITALRAVAEWHRKRAEKKEKAPEEVSAQVDRLAQSSIVELRVQAEATRQTFPQK